MPQVNIKKLLEAGVHFGHQTQRWNPKMKKFIFGERNGIYIINLEITLACLDKALGFLRDTAASGKEILWIGTKKQAQESLQENAKRCGMPFVNQRWLGGMLTNFETVRRSIKRMELIDKMESDGSFQFITKKERNSLIKEREKLQKVLSGVKDMKRLPGAVFVIDSKNEEIGVREARKLGIPVVGVLDTNCDPDMVDYPLPGNDDAIRSVRLFCELAAGAIEEGHKQMEQSRPQAEEAQTQEAPAATEEKAAPSEEAAEERKLAGHGAAKGSASSEEKNPE